MKIRYANRFLSGQKRILLWSYGFWFLASFLLVSLVVEAKQEHCETTVTLIETSENLTNERYACGEISLEPLLGLIPIS